ncbi:MULTISPECIES: hypothetical protein [unclassified Prochlorococcus]|uniref:hypothetical protein n=1 Tax=unclassified Prochlorococcus TaxID=2627481 RepID=UPI00053394FC|nr:MULTISPECIES: hypothetical protein [unclassified Prochlorococcus]KGG27565.1 hypothetical protein EV13_1967 [Prochlorococcus sp. MIT 0702]KGG28127.1 hypothetical protein EV12_0876 [Prochlorococcus sp. MIT 0701]KGG32794.1 hypothetical protein EV14_1935 [Prochlorococcus sp. MIT 0703]HJN33923.1 hypothetical protein [Prochlorococcus sp.]
MAELLLSTESLAVTDMGISFWGSCYELTPTLVSTLVILTGISSVLAFFGLRGLAVAKPHRAL